MTQGLDTALHKNIPLLLIDFLIVVARFFEIFPCSIPTGARDKKSAEFQRMSVHMRTVVCYMKQIPNQPIVFKVRRIFHR